MIDSEKAPNTPASRSAAEHGRNRHMVNEYRWRQQPAFECELCGASYAQLEDAERCEQYCYLHGRPSPLLTQKSVRKTPVTDGHLAKLAAK